MGLIPLYKSKKIIKMKLKTFIIILVINFNHLFSQIEITIYNENKVIEVFIKRDSMTHFEAVEYYEYNVLGAYMGEKTPIYIQEDF